jgi:hypothetical protein
LITRNTTIRFTRLAVFLFLSFALVIMTTAQTCAALLASGDVTIQAAMTQHSTLNDSAYQSSSGISGVYAKSEQSQS